MPGGYELPRRERMIKTADFLALYREGTKRVGRGFVCYTAWREGQGHKLGITVSRKVGKAVVRNRIKRYVREVYRTHRPLLAADVHFVVVARPHAARFDYHECQAALERLWREGNVLCE